MTLIRPPPGTGGWPPEPGPLLLSVFAAVMLVAGQLHIKNASARVPAVTAVHGVSLPL